MLKTCKQCGTVKPLEQFRNYYGGRKGTYTICKTCEKINSRVKYLKGKSELNNSEKSELLAILSLWETQHSLGYQPPRTNPKGNKSVLDMVTGLMDNYKEQSALLGSVSEEITTAPPELIIWLTKELTEEPDYYLDEVYEKLKEQYKPVLRLDNKSMLPVYDQRYSGILTKILERFWTYEDNYYSKDN